MYVNMFFVKFEDDEDNSVHWGINSTSKPPMMTHPIESLDFPELP